MDFLKDGEEGLKKVLDTVMEGVSVVDADEVVLFCNPAFLKIFEAPPEETMIGRSILEFLDEDQKDHVLQQTQARRVGESSQYEIRINTCKNTQKTIFLSASPMTDSDGRYVGTIGVFFDISRLKFVEDEKRRVEEELLEREARYRALFDFTNDGIFIFSTDDVHLEVNQKAADLLGYSVEEIVGTPIKRYTKPAEHDDGEDKGSLLLAGERVPIYERTFVRKDGSEFPAEVNIALIRDKDGNPLHYHSIVRDISERKEAELKLRESEESYRSVFDNATDAIYIQDASGRFLDVNEGVVKMYGYPKSFFIGKTPEFLAASGKNDLDALQAAIDRAKKGEPQQFEFWGVRRNGEVFPKIVRLNRGVYFGNDVVIAHALDISAIKKTEKEMKKYAATQDILIREVNHRVKNNLASIISIIHMERERREAVGGEGIDEVLNELTKRIEGLLAVHRLLAESKWEPIQLSTLCRDIIMTASESTPPRKEMRFDVPASPVKVDSDRAHHLAWVINELVGNSVKHVLKDQDVLEISVRIETRDGRILLFFGDNGRGYPKEMIRGDYGEIGVGFELILGIISHLNGKIELRQARGALAVLILEEQ